jgi:hypothetical protein
VEADRKEEEEQKAADNHESAEKGDATDDVPAEVEATASKKRSRGEDDEGGAERDTKKVDTKADEPAQVES